MNVLWYIVGVVNVMVLFLISLLFGSSSRYAFYFFLVIYLIILFAIYENTIH